MRCGGSLVGSFKTSSVLLGAKLSSYFFLAAQGSADIALFWQHGSPATSSYIRAQLAFGAVSLCLTES